jgi:hypothetical protein
LWVGSEILDGPAVEDIPSVVVDGQGERFLGY